MENAKPLSKFDGYERNWKKRLIIIAAQNDNVGTPLATINSTSQNSVSTEGTQDDGLHNIPQDASDSIPVQINANEFPGKRHIRKASDKLETIKRARRLSNSDQYVQFCITHVYSPLEYTEALENILQKNNEMNAMEVLDSSIIEYLSSNVPVLHSTANITVFRSNEVPKEESLNTGINYDLLKLRKKFQEFKHEFITLLNENNNRQQKYYKELQAARKNQNFEIQKTVKNALPSKSLKEFLKFNDLLERSLPHREGLKKMYRVVISGETRVKSCIRKIMKFTVSKVVEAEYSGVGKKFRGVTKLNYSRTQTFLCLQDVLIEKFGLISKLKNLGGRVGQWLASNVDRENVRTMKNKNKPDD